MSRRFTIVSVALAGFVSFLVGAIVAGGVGGGAVTAGAPAKAGATKPIPVMRSTSVGLPAGVVNFADVVERINPAVVNVEATTRPSANNTRRRRPRPDLPEVPDPFNGLPGNPRGDRDSPRRGSGSGFIIDADGSILTNNHVIDGADRIIVKLSDGRTLRAKVIGSDPDTDIALIKEIGEKGLPVAPVGD